KRIMKDRQTTSLQLHPEINQNIPAADEIEPRKWRIRGDVLFCKRADLAHHPVDLIGAVELFEKAFQARRRNIFFNCARINAQPRAVDSYFAQVGPEYLDPHLGGSLAKRF